MPRLVRFLSAVSRRCRFCPSESPPSQGRDVFFSRVPPFVHLSNSDLPSLIMLELKNGSFENGELRWNGTPFPLFLSFQTFQSLPRSNVETTASADAIHFLSNVLASLFSLSYSVPIAHRFLLRIPELFAVQSRYGGEYSAVFH